ncbi:DUF5518 domain-containing protein [Halorubellus sp. PRR65]|uniref:DUF5518 domain-containing protein n=1 Tax=Halorubellus sp. PRR65 TaxID=3098148 RepID=UPI002B25D996|nr:DUF5518 domain-containing protein [Halorubellus sp. PRR65]
MTRPSARDDPLQPVRDAVRTSMPAIAGFGALVAFLTGFVPGSPLLGGAVAGWLVRETRRRGALAGAIAGVLFSLPSLVALWAILAVAFGISFFAVIPAAFGFLLVLFGLAGVAYTLGLGALGGYLGVVAYQRRYQPSSTGDATGGARSRDSQFDDTQF